MLCLRRVLDRPPGLAMVVVALFFAFGCQPSNPLVTKANCQKAQQMKTLKEVEALLGPGSISSAPNLSEGDRLRRVHVAQWFKWRNSNGDGEGHALVLFVGIDDNGDIRATYSDLEK